MDESLSYPKLEDIQKFFEGIEVFLESRID